MSKENIEDMRVLAARVNRTVEQAQVKDATIDEWKVLIFLQSIDLLRYSHENDAICNAERQSLLAG